MAGIGDHGTRRGQHRSRSGGGLLQREPEPGGGLLKGKVLYFWREKIVPVSEEALFGCRSILLLILTLSYSPSCWRRSHPGGT